MILAKSFKTIAFWVRNARPKAIPQSIMPAFLALCMASHNGGFSLTLGIIAVCGVVLGHLGINLFDDYFDYRFKTTQIRQELTHQGVRARINKCAYLSSKEATLPQLLTASLVFILLALFCATILFVKRGPFIFYLAAIAVFLGVSYSGGPLRFSYRGLGELLIGLMFGPLLMTGVYYAAAGAVDSAVVIVAVPVGLLVANIVYVHAIMDYEADKQAGKMTFAVLLGNRKLMLTSLLVLLLLSYGFLVAGGITGYLSAYYLGILLTLPMAITLYRLMTAFVRYPDKEYLPTVWMGPMPNWAGVQKTGIAWFMIRWYLARNLLIFFCLILIAVNWII